MKHELKIAPAFFEAVIRGNKKCEVRDNSDRGFQKGDLVLFCEYDATMSAGTKYTGREQLVEITYVSDYNQPANQVVFSFSLVE